jgi:small subunit ribosomal protein S21
MIRVNLRQGEPIDKALKKMKKKLKDEGVLDAARQRRYFIPKAEKRKKQKQKAYYAQLMREWKNK